MVHLSANGDGGGIAIVVDFDGWKWICKCGLRADWLSNFFKIEEIRLLLFTVGHVAPQI
jgi:hypothetical protein